MKFLFILLFCIACNSGGGGGSETGSTAGLSNFTGSWTSIDGNSRFVLNEDGTASFFGVCDWEWSSYVVDFDEFGQGFVRFQGLNSQPQGAGLVCSTYTTGPGVTMQLSAELESLDCILVDYGTPGRKYCRD